jgi:hypothetical protein
MKTPGLGAKMVTQAEAAFRIRKDQLRVRPIWHQHADRVEAHILVCFLAFVLWKSLEMWQRLLRPWQLAAHRARRTGTHPVA